MTHPESQHVDDLISEIETAGDADFLIALGLRIPGLLADVMERTSDSVTMIGLTSHISDAVITACLNLAVDELGPPPVPFSFLVFGSVGRREQTLKTDQDNALVYDDVPESEAAGVRDYFQTLSRRICTVLHQAGYTYCDGDNMAMNPRYCLPLATWKQRFTTWVCSAEAADLLRLNIFFDFRHAWGEEGLATALRRHVNDLLAANDRFFQILARNILGMVLPIGLFGRFIVEREGPHRGSFNIKHAMMPIVDIARLYAMKHGLAATNTLSRLAALRGMNVMNDMGRDLAEAYLDLMGMRLTVQARAQRSQTALVSNHVYPNSLSVGEQKKLRGSFAKINAYRSKLSRDFIGSAPM
jgi:CBS domain-containing protein